MIDHDHRLHLMRMQAIEAAEWCMKSTTQFFWALIAVALGAIITALLVDDLPTRLMCAGCFVAAILSARTQSREYHDMKAKLEFLEKCERQYYAGALGNVDYL